MNVLDLAILAIIILCAFLGYKKGLIRTVYRLASFIVAIFIARQLYPAVARILRQTPLLPMIESRIVNSLNLEAVVQEHVAARGTEIINALPLPGILQSLLHANYNPDMFELLQVATIEEYITGFFANMVINGIAVLIVFALTLILLAIIGHALDLVSKLPVIRTVNSVCGFIFGFAISSVIIWLCLIVAAVAFSGDSAVVELMEESWIAQWLFETTFTQLATVA